MIKQTHQMGTHT